MRLEQDDSGYCIDASLLGELLGVAPQDVQPLMRSNDITGVCERGEGEHEGQFRLSFFYKGRHARLDVDERNQILKRSIVDVGEQRAARQRAGAPSA